MFRGMIFSVFSELPFGANFCFFATGSTAEVMTVEIDVAGSLLALSTPVRSSCVVNAEDTREEEEQTLHLDANRTPNTTPIRAFKLAGIKRNREQKDMITAIYTCGDDSMAIPLFRGETRDCFFQRRAHAARILFDDSRRDVYVTWQRSCSLVNIVVTDPCWIMYRESLQQKRFRCGVIQLVITRYTCTQWKEGESCRNCSNRKWRTGCLTPTYLYHVMPLPANQRQQSLDACETELLAFEPIDVQKNPAAWMKRVPCINVR